MNRRVALALILGAVVATHAEAQTTPPATPAPPPVTPATPAAIPLPSAQAKLAGDDVPPPPTPVALPANAQKDAVPRLQARAVKAETGPVKVAEKGRFANPGGVGRFSEYYTPYTPMTRYQGPPVRPAGFGTGGAPNRADQLAAFQAGQFRTQNIQNNLNAYGRPIGFGIGYGVGFGRGFGGLR